MKHLKNYINEIFLGMIILFVIIIRIRLLDIPLERDEGEYAYIGQLILQGIAPFTEAYNMKFPGTYYCYAFFELLFGQTSRAIHLGLLFVNVATIIFVFQLAKKMIAEGYYALLAAGVFALTSLSFTVFGFAAHATHFVMLFVIGGLLLLYKTLDHQKLWMYSLAGIVTGLSYMMKQSGIFFFLFAVLLILISDLERNHFQLKKFILHEIIFIASGLLPFVVMILLLWINGGLEKFYFWTFIYAPYYANQVPSEYVSVMFKEGFQGIWLKYGAFIFIAIAGVISFFFIRKKFYRALTVALFFILSFLSTTPGFYFRQHYVIQMLPAIAIAFGAAALCIDTIFKNKFKTQGIYINSSLFLIIATIGINKESHYLFKASSLKIAENIYTGNPFVAAIEVAGYLKQHTNPDEKIAVAGSEPEIFFYAKRRSATGYIYTYSLMEKHPYSLVMQKEMAGEIEKSQPQYFVYVHASSSWLIHEYSEKYILDWYDKYISANYRVVAAVDMTDRTAKPETVTDVEAYQPKGEEYILIFKRSDTN